MKCRHEAWEETPFGPGMVSRRCADCREPLDPIAKPAPKPTDFQVGDRVSVEGVVTDVVNDVELPVFVRLNNAGIWQDPGSLTLIERPRRKLRVGSVWHPSGSPGDRYVVAFIGREGREKFIELSSGVAYWRDDLTFDSSRAPWREVPVEELEREAGS